MGLKENTSQCLGGLKWKIKVYVVVQFFFLVKNSFFLQPQRKHDDRIGALLSNFRMQIVNLKQLFGFKKQKR